MKLFLIRCLEGLRDRRLGRVLLAYGFGSHQPALGLAVQREIGALALAYEAILPHFNRYDGAQAVGSAADLYQLRPTGGTWPAIDRTRRGPLGIYTHGERSVESGATRDPALEAALLDAAAGPDRLAVAAVVTPDRPRADKDEVALAELLAGPGAIRNGRSAAVAVDATADPGPWLARILLAAAGPRLAVAVPNNHPDTTSQAAQQSLATLVAAKWTLRFRRSTPDPGHAIIEAVRVDPAALSPADTVRRAILDGAHRSLENAWRDGLVKASRRAGDPPLTKDAAQRLIDGLRPPGRDPGEPADRPAPAPADPDPHQPRTARSDRMTRPVVVRMVTVGCRPGRCPQAGNDNGRPLGIRGTGRLVAAVREGGLEPPRPFGHWHLKPARLPFRHSRVSHPARV